MCSNANSNLFTLDTAMTWLFDVLYCCISYTNNLIHRGAILLVNAYCIPTDPTNFIIYCHKNYSDRLLYIKNTVFNFITLSLCKEM